MGWPDGVKPKEKVKIEINELLNQTQQKEKLWVHNGKGRNAKIYNGCVWKKMSF